MSRITAETIRQLATAAGVRPGKSDLDELASGLEALIGAIERCQALDLSAHEPAAVLRLSGGPSDAQL